MSYFRLPAFLIAAVALLRPDATIAMTLVHFPPPDARLVLSVPPAKLGDLRRVLMDFAGHEHMSEFKDAHAPRARGKQFFLSLYSEKYSVVAEKTSGIESVMIECTDFDSSFSRAQAQGFKVPYDTESPFGRMVSRLKQSLKFISPDITEER